MANRFIIYLLLLVTFFFSACGKKKLPREEYLQWMQHAENGLHKSKKIGDFVFDLQFWPVEMGVGAKPGTDTTEFNYFVLKIDHKKGDLLKQDDTQQYSSRLYYYSYTFQSALSLDEGGQIIPCEIYHFERSYDLTTAKNFVLAFPRTKKLGSCDLTMNIDATELGLGMLKVKFSKEELNAIPELVL